MIIFNTFTTVSFRQDEYGHGDGKKEGLNEEGMMKEGFHLRGKTYKAQQGKRTNESMLLC